MLGMIYEIYGNKNEWKNCRKFRHLWELHFQQSSVGRYNENILVFEFIFEILLQFSMWWIIFGCFDYIF